MSFEGSPFAGPLVTRHNLAGSKLIVAQDMRVELLPFGTVIVPGGLPTNLASIPRVLWCIYPPFGRYSYAAVVHDFLYCQGAAIYFDGASHAPDRRTADAILRQLMRRSGCRWYTCWLFWLAVRAFGWLSWHKD